MRLFWCYGNERLNAYINRWIHDRAQPLTNLVNAYRSRRVVDYLPPESIASCRTQAKDFPGLTETMDRLVADTEVPARGVSINITAARAKALAPYAVPAHYVPLIAYVASAQRRARPWMRDAKLVACRKHL